jgi:hypothetical protein
VPHGLFMDTSNARSFERDSISENRQNDSKGCLKFGPIGYLIWPRGRVYLRTCAGHHALGIERESGSVSKVFLGTQVPEFQMFLIPSLSCLEACSLLQLSA